MDFSVDIATKPVFMDFKVCGKRFYAMVSPEGNCVGQSRNTLPIPPRPILKYIMHLLTKMKFLNCQALNGITVSAN